MLEVKISAISCKVKPTYVFVFVLSAILDASILEPKISTRYHVYDCEMARVKHKRKEIHNQNHKVCHRLHFKRLMTSGKSLTTASTDSRLHANNLLLCNDMLVIRG